MITQVKALLYFYWVLIINTRFVEQTSRQCKSTSLPKILVMILLCGWDFSLVLIIMPPMYLWSSHQYHLGYLSDEWEHAPPVTRAITELYRQHACEVQLQSTSQACRRWRLVWPSSWPLQCSYQNSIPSSTGGHVAFASAAYENQAFWPRARQGKISSFTMFISEHQCKTNVRRFCSLITQIIFFCNS